MIFLGNCVLRLQYVDISTKNVRKNCPFITLNLLIGISARICLCAAWKNLRIISLSMTHALQVSARRAKQWCDGKNDIPYFETSAKEAINVEQAFQTIAKNALAQEADDGFPETFPDNITLNPGQRGRDSSQGSGCGCWWLSGHTRLKSDLLLHLPPQTTIHIHT